jgi:carbon monoxide dehydrogenase subunit G
MNVSGQFTVQAPREVVFETLRDARRFVGFVEGVSGLQEIDATHYAAVFETKIAYMKFRFNVTVEVTRIEPPGEIEAKIEGTPLGIVGRLVATSLTRLSEAGNETRVDYSVDAMLAGKLGSIGQPVLRAKAREMEKRFAENLRAAFAPAAAETPR